MMMMMLVENFPIVIDCSHAVQGVESKPRGFFEVQRSCPLFVPFFFNLFLFLTTMHFSLLNDALQSHLRGWQLSCAKAVRLVSHWGEIWNFLDSAGLAVALAALEFLVLVFVNSRTPTTADKSSGRA